MITAPQKSHIAPMLSAPHCRPIDRALELALLHQAQAGDRKALHRLVLANMKFVAAVARKYQHHGLSAEDLIQEGAMGLQHAIQKFNPANPNRLISYAVWWIRQRILMALAEQARTVNMPPRIGDLGPKAEAARRRLEQEHARTPTLEEVAEAISMAADKLGPFLALLAPRESLDHPIGDNTTRIDMMAGPDDTAAASEQSRTERAIRTLLHRLEPIDQDVITRYFGLVTDVPETLGQIGDHLGVSRERVRQRVMKALEKLRPGARKMGLAPATEEET